MPDGHSWNGFTPEQLTLIHKVCVRLAQKPKLPISRFHNVSPYLRKQTTTNVINEAFEKRVIVGPYLYCNSNIEVELIDNLRKPIKYWQEHKEDPGVNFCLALRGDWSYICFKRGSSMLEFTDTPLPSYPAICKIEDLYFEEEGILPRDKYPHGWDDDDWLVYNAMREARKKTYRELEKELGLSMFTIRKHYLRILEQCKVLVCFFPNCFEGYQYVLLTFRTKYEVGLRKALSRLDRSTYLYRYNGLLILHLQVDPGAQEYNRATARFGELEEMGIIRDLRVSVPSRWKNIHT